MQENKSQPNFEDKIHEVLRKIMPIYLKGRGFTDRKLTDTPTDALQVVNRKYVTMNGVTASRPTSSVFGQSYFDNTINKPIWYSSVVGAWVDATGTVV